MPSRGTAARESAERRRCPECGRKGALFTWAGSGVIECRYCPAEYSRAQWESKYGPMRARDEAEMRRAMRESGE